MRMWLQWGAAGGDWPGKNYMLGLGMEGTYRQDPTEENEPRLQGLDVGENPPRGVIVYYYLSEVPSEDLRLTFLDRKGNKIKSVARKDDGDEAPADDDSGDSSKKERYLTAHAGINRFVWDLCYPEAEKFDGDVTTKGADTSLMAAPGTYRVVLELGDRSWTHDFRLTKDPRSSATQEDLEAQFQTLGPDPGQGIRNPWDAWADRSNSGPGETMDRAASGVRAERSGPGGGEPGG